MMVNLGIDSVTEAMKHSTVTTTKSTSTSRAGNARTSCRRTLFGGGECGKLFTGDDAWKLSEELECQDYEFKGCRKLCTERPGSADEDVDAYE